jgi:hypothetical protein
MGMKKEIEKRCRGWVCPEAKILFIYEVNVIPVGNFHDWRSKNIFSKREGKKREIFDRLFGKVSWMGC